MNQNHFMFTLISHMTSLTSYLFFILFLRATALSTSVDPRFLACVPKSYGDGTNISYPFYIQHHQHPFCGCQGFELSCNKKGKPILKLPDNDNQYTINHIFYKNHSLRLSNAESEAYTCSACIISSHIQNLSLSTDRFELVSKQAEVFLLSKCNSSSLPEKLLSEKADNCLTQDDKHRTVLALVKDDPDLGMAKKECKHVVMAPVDGYGGPKIEAMAMLRRGFLVKWIVSDCEESGGKCGFNQSTSHFKCFCPDRPHVRACNRSAAGHLTVKVAAAATGSGIGILIIILLASCFMRKFSFDKSLAFWTKKTENYQNIEAFLRNYVSLAPKRYSYLEIKKMTNSFKVKLGQGGYGKVYKGRRHNGRDVAVKVLKESKGNGEEFINEVASISRTSHVNVVNFFGYCFEGRKRALIYEFVPNGSLEKFIYENDPKHTQLKWENLYQIAVGIARGLEYLHRGCNTRILHFDIKPHNILLDENFYPKISDFGLAKICPRTESIISMTGLRGTVGFIAPEIEKYLISPMSVVME